MNETNKNYYKVLKDFKNHSTFYKTGEIVSEYELDYDSISFMEDNGFIEEVVFFKKEETNELKVGDFILYQGRYGFITGINDKEGLCDLNFKFNVKKESLTKVSKEKAITEIELYETKHILYKIFYEIEKCKEQQYKNLEYSIRDYKDLESAEFLTEKFNNKSYKELYN